MAPVPVTLNQAEIAAEIYRYTTAALTCGRVPVFGSAEWCDLGDADPAKGAAVVRAALAHWTASVANVEAHIQASHAVSAAHDWAAQAAAPTRAQILRWRQAVRPAGC